MRNLFTPDKRFKCLLRVYFRTPSVRFVVRILCEPFLGCPAGGCRVWQTKPPTLTKRPGAKSSQKQETVHFYHFLESLVRSADAVLVQPVSAPTCGCGSDETRKRFKLSGLSSRCVPALPVHSIVCPRVPAGCVLK